LAEQTHMAEAECRRKCEECSSERMSNQSCWDHCIISLPLLQAESFCFFLILPIISEDA
jgi:hypothetical protein